MNGELALAMVHSGFLFQLTGSRFFGTERLTSDWDFFVQYSPAVEKWLVKYGFHRSLDYEVIASQGVWGRDNVHIQLVSDFALKMRIQLKLLPFAHLLKDKRQAKQIWALAYVMSEPHE